MRSLTKSEIEARLTQEACNSSHFVWLIGDFEFLETSTGWAFALERHRSRTLFALEPLIPLQDRALGEAHLISTLKKSLEEIQADSKLSTPVFVGINDPFRRYLEAAGFKSAKVGKDPWIKLGNYLPKGNAGKGVRTARNRAQKEGVEVSEWNMSELATDESKRKTLKSVLRSWKDSKALQLNGFLLATDPYLDSPGRRLFIASKNNEVVAFLTASPVKAQKEYYLEDVIVRDHAPHGTSELLILSALAALEASGVESASLGVVSVNDLGGDGPKTGLRYKILAAIKAFVSLFYNSKGLEIYRKRFSPDVWKEVFIAAPAQSVQSKLFGWPRHLAALVRSFKPRLRLTPKAILRAVTWPIRKHPVTSLWFLLSFTNYMIINDDDGQLPPAILKRFGFIHTLSLDSMLYRTFTNDFLVANTSTFLMLGLLAACVIPFLENRLNLKFLLGLFIMTSFLDDFFDHFLIMMPLKNINPALFARLPQTPQIGSSLILTLLLGVAVHQITRYREIIFAVANLALFFVLIHTSPTFPDVIMNSHYFIFFGLGHIVGKLHYERGRHLSRIASKAAPA